MPSCRPCGETDVEGQETLEPILEVKHLTHTYGVGTPFERSAVEDMSFEVERGEFLGIIGHTGSGKSTLVQLLNGLTRPEAGRVLLDGQDIWQDPKQISKVRFRVGLVMQYPEYQLFEETVRADIAFGPRNMQLSGEEIAERVDEAAAFAGVDPSLLDKSPFDLSGGQKRRVAIAGIMAMRPEVLVLDEPAAGLDPQGRRDIFGGIRAYNRETGSTVVIVSHSMEDMAQYCDDVAVMAHARLLMTGTRDEVFARADELEAVGLDIPVITKLSALLRQGGMPLDPGLYTLEAAEAALAQVFGLPADREGGKKR